MTLNLDQVVDRLKKEGISTSPTVTRHDLTRGEPVPLQYDAQGNLMKDSRPQLHGTMTNRRIGWQIEEPDLEAYINIWKHEPALKKRTRHSPANTKPKTYLKAEKHAEGLVEGVDAIGAIYEQRMINMLKNHGWEDIAQLDIEDYPDAPKEWIDQVFNTDSGHHALVPIRLAGHHAWLPWSETLINLLEFGGPMIGMTLAKDNDELVALITRWMKDEKDVKEPDYASLLDASNLDAQKIK